MLLISCIFVSNEAQFIQQSSQNQSVELYNDIQFNEKQIIDVAQNITGNNFTLSIDNLQINSASNIIIQDIILKQQTTDSNNQIDYYINTTYNVIFRNVQFLNINAASLINTSYGTLTFEGCIFTNSVINNFAVKSYFQTQFRNCIFFMEKVNFNSNSPSTILDNTTIIAKNIEINESVDSINSYYYSAVLFTILNPSLGFNSQNDVFSITDNLQVTSQTDSFCSQTCTDNTGKSFGKTNGTLELNFPQQEIPIKIDILNDPNNPQSIFLTNLNKLIQSECSTDRSGFMCQCNYLQTDTECTKTCPEYICHGTCTFTAPTKDFNSITCESCTPPFTNLNNNSLCLENTCGSSCNGHTCGKSLTGQTFYSCECKNNTKGEFCESCETGYTRVGIACFKNVQAGGICYLKDEKLVCNQCDSGLVLSGGQCVRGLTVMEGSSLSVFVLVSVIFVAVVIFLIFVLIVTRKPRYLTHKPDRNVFNDGQEKKTISLNAIIAGK